MDEKGTCFRLLHSESEKEVQYIVDGCKELSDTRNWHPIDGRESNFNVVTNQASVGSKALTELCTNMVDAILMKCAQQKNISATGSNAPKSVIEAVKSLVDINGMPSGILAEVDSPQYLQEFAEKNLIIGVTGGTKKEESLCFTFIDNGEGQHASKFEDTFLSLSKGNKSNIPFVQGKYNMGSSGVLSYCGRRWFKLIVSRRYNLKGEWGWTLVRRRPGSGKPIAEFFKYRQSFPTFSHTDLRPMKLRSGELDDKVSLQSGTVVKLFDYQLETNATFNKIREAINENLVSTILPFRLMDYRVAEDRNRGGRRALGVDERPLNGMEFLLLNRDGDNATSSHGDQIHIGDIQHRELGVIRVRAIELAKEMPGWLKPNRNRSRIYHSVNGQVQFKQSRAFLTTPCKLPGLKDRIVVIVDASDLTEAAHNDVWKGDRENIRRTEMGQLYIDKVANLIKDSAKLKDMQRRIAREEVESLTKKGRIELFQDLVNSDPSIAQLLPNGVEIRLPSTQSIGPQPPKWVGKYSPTFLRVKGKKVKREGADIALGESRRVGLETDVVNDYFTRPTNQGKLLIDGLNNAFDYSTALHDGLLSITFASSSVHVVVGDEFILKIELIDDAMVQPVSTTISLRIVKERKIPPPGPPQPPRDEDEPNGDEEPIDSRSLPQSKWLTRDGRNVSGQVSERWPDEFTEQDGGEVRDLDEMEKLYCINYDNAHLHRFLREERDEVHKKVITEQFRIGMLVLMMGLEDAYSRMDRSSNANDLSSYIDEVRRLAARGSATVVLSIAKTLPTLVNDKSVADPDE